MHRRVFAITCFTFASVLCASEAVIRAQQDFTDPRLEPADASPAAIADAQPYAGNLLDGSGLLGSYFDRPDLTDFVEDRVDGEINFPSDFSSSPIDIGNAPPGVNIRPDDNWSVRWTGHVRIDSPGEWRFHTDSDDGVRLWVNGEQIIDNWSVHPLQRDTGAINLAAGWTPIRLEFFQSGHIGPTNRAAIRLLFEGPNQPEVVVPQSHLASHVLKGVDVGKVGFAGSTTIDHRSGSYAIAGSGADIQADSDCFHFAQTTIQGDCTITAKVNSIAETNPFAKAGVMFRESLEPGSRNVVMEMKASTGSEFQHRPEEGEMTVVGRRVPGDEVSAPYWVRLQRQGNSYMGYTSSDGVNWELQDTANLVMPEKVYVGICVTAHDNTKLTTAELSNVMLAYEPLSKRRPRITGTNVTGFIPLLSAETFDPLTDDGDDPANFWNDDDEFYTFRGQRYDVRAAEHGPGFDEDEGKQPDADDIVFRLTPEGLLHILGVADRGQSEAFGYISTEDSYRNYHLSLEYKWGEKKFAPRERQKRDSGLLYHATGPDVVWTTNVETQIQEGDTGDFFFLGESPQSTSGVALGSSEATVALAPQENRYQAAGEPVDSDGGVTKSTTVDSLDDWNRVEVILEHDNVTVVVNGIVVNRATNLRTIQEGFIVPLTEGKVALQSEGAEIFYRNVQIKPVHAVGSRGGYAVLLFQESPDPSSAHVESRIATQAAIKTLGNANGFSVDVINDSTGVFTDTALSRYAAVIWDTAAGDVLDDAEQQAFSRYIAGGGGFVGLSSSAATESEWEWYGDLVGARATLSKEVKLAMLVVDDEAAVQSGGSNLLHPAADCLPSEWRRQDVWPRFPANPRRRTNVLLSLKEDSQDGDRPISWWQDFGGGRSFYTGLGARPESAHEPLYLMHLLGGIEYAAGVSRVPPQSAIVLFDGTGVDEFVQQDGQELIDWQIDDEGALFIFPENGPAETRNVQSKRSFSDYRLHLEFNVPATRPGTTEQRRGNSGLYLHRSYELQILDSYGDPGFDDLHAGAIYGYKAADINATLPAETWQVYDIVFRAPRFDESGRKTADARLTAHLNCMLIHDDVEIPSETNGGMPESPGPKPFLLQDHDKNSSVRFRNIWVLPLGQ